MLLAQDSEPYIICYPASFTAPSLKLGFSTEAKMQNLSGARSNTTLHFFPRLWTEWNADTAPGNHKIRRTPGPIYVFTQEQARTYLQDLDALRVYCSLTTASSSPFPPSAPPPRLILDVEMSNDPGPSS